MVEDMMKEMMMKKMASPYFVIGRLQIVANSRTETPGQIVETIRQILTEHEVACQRWGVQ